MKLLRSSRLNERAIVVLIRELSGLPKAEIKLVLESMDALEEMFLKKVSR